MPGESIMACRSVTHDSALASVTHARLVPSTQFTVDQGPAGNPWPVGANVNHYALGVEIYGTDYAELLARVGAAAADCVIGISNAAGSAETLTISQVYFTEIVGPIDIREGDSGGKLPVFGIRGQVSFGAGEVFADVIAAA